MSLEEGAINYTDLSPNANIQGHQIADKTLRLRNFSDDTFGIAASGSAQMTVSSIAAGAVQTVSAAHNLGIVPAFLSFIQMPANSPNNNVPTGYLCMPQLWAITSSAAMWFSARVDTTNIYFDVTNTGSGTSTGPWVFNYKYYILQESAAS